jgi:hypothetical protein
MNKTKVIIALVAVAALTLTALGLASAQIATKQPHNGVNPNGPSNNGFWGWIGNCFGFRNSQPYANQYVSPPAGTNSQIPTPSQGNGNYYGFGSYWARFSLSP